MDIMKPALFIVCFAFVLFHAYIGEVTFLTLVLYLFSVIMCIYFLSAKAANYARNKSKASGKQSLKKDIALLFLLIIVQLAVIEFFSSPVVHFHKDEFIEAYASFTLPPIQKINWFAGYPEKNTWVDQNPILFFILQKPVLKLFGPSLESIRISILPYHFLVIVLLYFLAKEIFQRRASGFIAVLSLIFFAPNIYLSSLGVRMVMSTACVLGSFYYFIRLLNTCERKYSVLCGVFAACGFLAYAASYIILPLLVLFVIVEAIMQKSAKPFRLLIPAGIILLIVLLPFFVYSTTHENYFVRRINSVNLLRENNSTETSPLQLIYTRIVPNVKSIYTKDIGGVDAYSFGHQAFFNQFTFVLFIVGFLAALYRGLFLKEKVMIYLLIIMLASFFLGMVMTSPLGAFHRILIVFPFVALVIAIAVQFIFGYLKPVSRHLAFLSSIVIMAIFISANFYSALAMVSTPGDNAVIDDSLHIAAYIQEHIPKGTVIQISAFRTYHLERELFFRTHNQYNFSTKPFNMDSFSGENPIIVLYPQQSNIEELKKKFSNGIVVDTINDAKLKSHLIFISQP